jgi:uncharacterized protein with GYD domain
MATFTTIIRFTDQGIKDVKATCRRAEAFTAAADSMGIQVKSLYWTLGSIDGLLVFEAPDESTATAAMLHLGASGNVHTETARAFDSQEMQQILGKLK